MSGARIVVAGGGPVGLAVALGAARLPGVEVSLVEPAPPPPAPAEAAEGAIDHRVYALSPASIAFLGELGVHLPPARSATVRAMAIRGDAGAPLTFTSGQPLAVIAEHRALVAALYEAARERVDVRHGVAATEACDGSLRLADGTSLIADLVVAADGARSPLRAAAGITAAVKDYHCDGVVANFDCERPHGDVARQWFHGDSVLAWLPLPGRQVSMVWSLSREAAAGLPADAALAAAVAAAGQHALGSLSLASPVARFPLARVMAGQWVKPGLALVGDAAHTVHPLAGQGVNLGFADARHLLAALAARGRFSAVGDLAVLRRYERAGREAAFAVGEVTDRLKSLYENPSDWARRLRNEGLVWLDRMPAMKAALVDYATR